ncbi:hypothetical protein CCACVL1_09111 [Corchorus capsularis]|uniref:Uncharacterized protein n=1 Tax=Corchorus capsularis TaxID=210143 RepID=A0A1R3IXQ4_COCAP|nr:hypothetical protein CCACVL1_09111 [Corchorus capsularis]
MAAFDGSNRGSMKTTGLRFCPNKSSGNGS